LWVRFAQSIIYCVAFCRSMLALFLFSFGLLVSSNLCWDEYMIC